MGWIFLIHNDHFWATQATTSNPLGGLEIARGHSVAHAPDMPILFRSHQSYQRHMN